LRRSCSLQAPVCHFDESQTEQIVFILLAKCVASTVFTLVEMPSTRSNRQLDKVAAKASLAAAEGEKIYLSGEEVFSVGSKVSGRSQLVDAQHDVQWHDDPRGQSMRSATFQLKFADGSERPIAIRVLPDEVLPEGRPLRRTPRLVPRR
jgi:hypothetical protein